MRLTYLAAILTIASITNARMVVSIYLLWNLCKLNFVLQTKRGDDHKDLQDKISSGQWIPEIWAEPNYDHKHDNGQYHPGKENDNKHGHKDDHKDTHKDDHKHVDDHKDKDDKDEHNDDKKEKGDKYHDENGYNNGLWNEDKYGWKNYWFWFFNLRFCNFNKGQLQHIDYQWHSYSFE